MTIHCEESFILLDIYISNIFRTSYFFRIFNVLSVSKDIFMNYNSLDTVSKTVSATCSVDDYKHFGKYIEYRKLRY